MNVLVWFRRDLRVADHPALARAAALGRVLPLYVVDPADWRRPEAAARHWAFLAETLAGLRADLAALGAPLVVRTGDPGEVIARLARNHRIARVLSHSGDGSDPARARDRAVAERLRQAGLPWDLVPEAADPDPLIEAPLATVSGLTPVPGVEPGLIPAARALGLAEDPCPHRQPGGRPVAELLLAGAAARRIGAPPSPLSEGREGTRLSAHLALGALALPDALPRGLRERLDWRARCHARMRAEPGLDLPGPAAGPLAAFAGAETGLPVIDACLRSFRASGWLGASGRGLLAATAVHLLGIDRHRAGQVLARLSLDYDPAIHWPLMAAVAEGRLWRPVNPVRLGQEHDPEGAFLRRWLPELAAVPAPFLHAPWRWEGARAVLGRRYPEPLVDPASALRAARDRLRPPPPPRPAAVAVRAAHSRLDRVLVLPGTARAKAAGAQLCLDL